MKSVAYGVLCQVFTLSKLDQVFRISSPQPFAAAGFGDDSELLVSLVLVIFRLKLLYPETGVFATTLPVPS